MTMLLNETEVNSQFTDEQKAGVAHYMAQSTAVAKQHYRMKTMKGILATVNQLSILGGYVSSSETHTHTHTHTQ